MRTTGLKKTRELLYYYDLFKARMSLSHEKVQELQRENSHLVKENQRMTTHLSYAHTKLRFVNFTNHYRKNCSFKFIFYYLKIEDFFCKL